MILYSHFPCGSVDWNHKARRFLLFPYCHFPCGSVDWNHTQLDPYIFLSAVTSLAEVWIEIVIVAISRTASRVTSLAEVWIEMQIRLCQRIRSHRHFPCGSVDWNLLTKKEEPKLLLVTSLAEVWIEIFLSHHHCHRLFRHFPCGSVDWNTVSVSPYIRLFGHFPCGSVDWNFSTGLDGADGVSHFPCGSVDWNAAWNPLFCLWISSLPLRKCGLKWLQPWYGLLELPVTSLAEVWIEIFR